MTRAGKTNKFTPLGFTLFEMVIVLFVITILALVVIRGSSNLRMAAKQKQIESTMELIRQEIISYIATHEQVPYDNITYVGTSVVAGDASGYDLKPGFLQDIIKKYSRIDKDRIVMRAYPYDIDYHTSDDTILLVSKRQICNSAPYTEDRQYKAEDAVFKDFYNNSSITRTSNPRSAVNDAVVLEILYLTGEDNPTNDEYTMSKFITLQDLLRVFDCGGGNRTKIVTESLPPILLDQSYSASFYFYTPHKSSGSNAENDVKVCIQVRDVHSAMLDLLNSRVTFTNMPIASGNRAVGIFSSDCSTSTYIKIQGGSADPRDRIVILEMPLKMSEHFNNAGMMTPPNYLSVKVHIREGKDSMMQVKEYIVPIMKY